MPNSSIDLASEAIKTVTNGQVVNPEDLAEVLTVIPRLVAQIGIAGVVYVGDADDIPDELFLPLTDRLVLEIGPRFGTQTASIEVKQQADAVLRALASSKPSGFPVKVMYY